MAEKNFLSWVGFKGEDESKPAPTQNALERIRELENQLNSVLLIYSTRRVAQSLA